MGTIVAPTHAALSMRYRSSRPEVVLVKGVLKICSKFAGAYPCRSAISISNFIEITLRHGCSPEEHLWRAASEDISRKLV